MDCHNRSGHDFETPDFAVDRAIAEGRLDRSRPFTRRDAVAALQGKHRLNLRRKSVENEFCQDIGVQNHRATRNLILQFAARLLG